MDIDEINRRIGKLIRGLAPAVSDVPGSARLADLGLDSMDMVQLFTHVEREFGIRLTDTEVLAIDSVQSLTGHVVDKL